MYEFELTTIDEKQISSWDFEALKANFKKALLEYDNRVYTEKAIASEDKKLLTDIKTKIESKRKEFKKHCLEPYDRIEPEIKELTGMIDERLEKIKNAVDEFSDIRKENKEKEIRKYYDTKAVVLGGYAEKLYGKILDKKWLNASTTKNKYEKEMLIAISDAKRDIDKLTDLNSTFTDMLIDNYINGASIEECMTKYDEYNAVSEKCGARAEFTISNAALRREADDTKTSGEITIKVKAKREQTEKLFDFMKAMGIEFEIIH